MKIIGPFPTLLSCQKSEEIVLQQLLAYLNDQNLISPSQSAYRLNHSTKTALLQVNSDILLVLDSGNVSVLTLLDLSAAFDVVHSSILLNRLQHAYGLSDTVALLVSLLPHT